MITKESLEQRLKQFPGARDVQVVGNGKLIAKVLVGAWDAVDDGDRQEAVWRFLRENFSEQDLSLVEYVLTNAPADAP